jgi:cyclic pyranopterin phosphate synthase
MGSMTAGPPTSLSHLDADGRARMVDVGGKDVTDRTATASARFLTRPDVGGQGGAPPPPPAHRPAPPRIAGIQGAKRTSDLIPLCHPLPLTSVTVDFDFDEAAIVVTATAKTTGRTGVEMEALTAVAVAGLTLHDMVKAVDPEAILDDLKLVEKTGGKRGHWTRGALRPGTAAVLVASTAGAAGTREDTTGPVIAAWLEEHGYAVNAVTIAADADVAEALATIVATSPAVVITTGGTGMSPTDHTPEATRRVLDRELPGIAEAIRAAGLAKTPTAALSRGLAGTSGGTVVVNLPGSRGGVKDGLAVLDGLLDHLVAQIAGGGAHE